MGDGTCNRVLTSGSVGMGIPMGIPVGIPVGMGWVWRLKCHPHGSPGLIDRCVSGAYLLSLTAASTFQNTERQTDGRTDGRTT